MVCIALVGYCAYAFFSGIGAISTALAAFSWWTFFAACGLAFGNYVLRVFKWEFYLSRLGIRGVPKLESALIFFSGFVFTVSPGKVGEMFKSWVLFETHGIPVEKTAPIVIAERVTDVLGIVVLILVGSTAFGGQKALVLAGVGVFLVLTLLLVISSQKLSYGLIALVGKLPGPFTRIAPKLHDAYASLATLVRPRNLVIPTIISIFAWMLECLSLWILLRGFGEPASVALCCFFYATSTLAGAIIPVPGGLGVTETSLHEQMRNIGHISVGGSVAATTLVRFATLWFAVIVGIAALSLLKRKYPKLLS